MEKQAKFTFFPPIKANGEQLGRIPEHTFYVINQEQTEQLINTAQINLIRYTEPIYLADLATIIISLDNLQPIDPKGLIIRVNEKDLLTYQVQEYLVAFFKVDAIYNTVQLQPIVNMETTQLDNFEQLKLIKANTDTLISTANDIYTETVSIDQRLETANTNLGEIEHTLSENQRTLVTIANNTNAVKTSTASIDSKLANLSTGGGTGIDISTLATESTASSIKTKVDGLYNNSVTANSKFDTINQNIVSSNVKLDRVNTNLTTINESINNLSFEGGGGGGETFTLNLARYYTGWRVGILNNYYLNGSVSTLNYVSFTLANRNSGYIYDANTDPIVKYLLSKPLYTMDDPSIGYVTINPSEPVKVVYNLDILFFYLNITYKDESATKYDFAPVIMVGANSLFVWLSTNKTLTSANLDKINSITGYMTIQYNPNFNKLAGN